MTVDDIIKECIKAYKQEDPENTRLLNLCEKMQLIKLTEISVELDKRFKDYLDYVDEHESLSVKDLDSKTMGHVLVSYLKKNHEAEKELDKHMNNERRMGSENGFNVVYTDLNIISEYMSGMLERLELGRDLMPDEVFEKWKTQSRK